MFRADPCPACDVGSSVHDSDTFFILSKLSWLGYNIEECSKNQTSRLFWAWSRFQLGLRHECPRECRVRLTHLTKMGRWQRRVYHTIWTLSPFHTSLCLLLVTRSLWLAWTKDQSTLRSIQPESPWERFSSINRIFRTLTWRGASKRLLNTRDSR